MKKRLIKSLKIILPILLGVFFIVLSYNKFSPEEIEEIRYYFGIADYRFVALSVVMGILSNLSRAYRWRFLLRPIGYETRYANNVMAVYIAYLMNLFIPRSGEVSRAIVIDKYEDVPFEKAFGTIVSERATDFVVLLGFLVVAFSLHFELLYDYLAEQLDLSKLVWLGIAGMVVLLGFWLFFKNSRGRLKAKMKNFLQGLQIGIGSLFKMRQKGAFLFHTFFIWALYFGMFYIVIFALPETASIPLPAVLAGFVTGGLVIAFTNGGLGSYPFVLAALLALFGIPETAGTAFGWIVWASQTVAIMVFGTLSFLLLPVLNKEK